MLTTWMDELFYKALDWVQEKNEAVVKSTKIGA
jgi:hypothetical protein